jgi:hypothetical protein
MTVGIVTLPNGRDGPNGRDCVLLSKRSNSMRLKRTLFPMLSRLNGNMAKYLDKVERFHMVIAATVELKGK